MLKLLLALLLVAGSHATDAPMPMTEPDLDTISIYIKKTLENLRDAMPNGIPELQIPPLEPFKLPVLNIPKIQHGVANVDLNLKDITVGGLSSFVVRDAKGNAGSMRVELDLFFPEVAARGEYDLNGKILIFPLYGKGPAAFQVNDLKIHVAASVTIENMKKVQLSDLRVDLTFSQVQVYLGGILGGGSIGDVVNTLINAMGKLVYDKLKDRILPEVTRILVTVVNNELRKVDLQQIIGGMLPNAAFSAFQNNEANIYVDKVMENLRPHIRQNNLDPAPLPDIVERFSKKIVWVEVWGEARLFNGRAHGLSTIHRAGNCDIGNSGTVVTVGCIVGVNDLRGNFDVRAGIQNINVHAHVSVHVDRVRVNFRVSADLMPGSSPSLQHFSIAEVTQIKVGVHGLGPLDWILTPIANAVVHLFKNQIVAAIEHPVRAELQKVIGTVQVPQMV